MLAGDVTIMRVFARSPRVPSPQAVADTLRSGRFEVRVESGVYSAGYEGWSRLHLFYAEGRLPLALGRQSLQGDAPLPGHLRVLMDATASAPDSRGKRRVLEFLAQAGQVFELSLPPDFEQRAGRRLLSAELIDYLQKETDGLIQVDGEGYYDRNRIILKL